MKLFPYLLVMALVTYLIRMLPLAFFRKKITSPFLLGVLHYMPYAVLGTMTVPAIFTSTGAVIPSVVGFAAAGPQAPVPHRGGPGRHRRGLRDQFAVAAVLTQCIYDRNQRG